MGYLPALESDFDFLSALHVAAMKEYVDKTWGWDEAFRASFFRRNYAPDVVRILTFDGVDMGMLVVEEGPEDIFLHYA